MAATPRILPCPFCGRDPITESVGMDRRGLMIECMTDGCVNPHVSYYDHASAIRAWNRRGGVDLAQRGRKRTRPKTVAESPKAAFERERREQIERNQEIIRNRGRGPS